jgi:hypothetical protein
MGYPTVYPTGVTVYNPDRSRCSGPTAGMTLATPASTPPI